MTKKVLYTPIPRALSSVLNDVMEGRIGLPDLQRPFVWSDKKVGELLDSMMKGYPIGYVLLWKAPEEYSKKQTQIGENDKVRPESSDLVIDGQQRLTALVSAMYGVEIQDKNYKSKVIHIAYNPFTREFMTKNAATGKNARYIDDIGSVFLAKKDNAISSFRKSYIAKLNQANEKSGIPGLTEEEETEVENGINALLDLDSYSLPTLEISRDADEEAVADIFVRVNSLGKSLTQDDFIMTILSVYAPEMRNEIEAFSKMSYLHEGGTSSNAILEVTPSLLIRATVALGLRRGRLKYAYSILRGRDLKTKETTAETREANLETFGDALEKVLDLNSWHAYLNALGSAGYVSADQISSANAVIYTYALYLIGKHQYAIDSVTLNRFAARWFFMASLTELYTGSFESEVERELTAIDDLETKEDYLSYFDNEIAVRLTDDFFDITLPNNLDANEAKGSSWYAFTASQIINGSKVLFNTVPLSSLFIPGASGTKKAIDKHHIFPDHFLEECGYEKKRSNRGNFTCLDYQNNIYIKDENPAIYVKEYRSKLGEEAYLRNCEEHALPVDFETMDYLVFIETRRKLMAALIKKAYKTL